MNNNISVETMINDLYEMIDASAKLPLSKDKAIISVTGFKDMLDDIKANLPQEIRQARGIVADRNRIISQANQEAESIIHTAEDRVKKMVSKSEIVRQAQHRSNEILTDAKMKSSDMRKAAADYIDDIMKQADDDMSRTLSELKKARQNIKASQRKNTQQQ